MTRKLFTSFIASSLLRRKEFSSSQESFMLSCAARKFFALIIIVILTSSCSIYHIDSTGTADTYYSSKPTSEVIYQESISRPHKIIGTVTVNAERRQHSMDNVIEKMKREAGILGGDAITDIQSDATGIWKRLPVQQTIGNAYVRANFTSSVVVFE